LTRKENPYHSDYLQLYTIEEGFFQSGKKQGYCRVFNTIEETTTCGFYENDEPNGKLVIWKNEKVIEMGIYSG
jgi:hypothetical protein